MMTRIVLVRHGETEWNRLERFRGRADVPLNARGVAQAEAVARRIAAEGPLDAVYSSPLSRALRTAEAIAARAGLTAQVCPGLVDIDYGLWQGLTPAEVEARWPDVLRAWYEKPQEARIPGGETLGDLRRRGMEALRGLAARHEGGRIAAVGHTVINRAILLEALGAGNDRFWRLRQDTCALNVLEVEGGEFTVVSLNDTCHLKPNC